MYHGRSFTRIDEMSPNMLSKIDRPIVYKGSMAKRELALTRPLVAFDLETTGLDIARDRIVPLEKVNPAEKRGLSIPGGPDAEIEDRADLPVTDLPWTVDGRVDGCRLIIICTSILTPYFPSDRYSYLPAYLRSLSYS